MVDVCVLLYTHVSHMYDTFNNNNNTASQYFKSILIKVFVTCYIKQLQFEVFSQQIPIQSTSYKCSYRYKHIHTHTTTTNVSFTRRSLFPSLSFTHSLFFLVLSCTLSLALSLTDLLFLFLLFYFNSAKSQHNDK